jgi:peptidase E
LRQIYRRAGARNPVIAYSGAANNERADFFTWARTSLIKAGARDVRHADSRKPQSAVLACRSADMVFVSGGDVDAGMRRLAKSGLAIEFKKIHQAGKVFIGVSAGSIILARAWVRWTGKNEDAPVMFDCLGIAPVYCDTHDEPEWEELKALLELSKKPARGYGLRSGAAAYVKNRRLIRLAGDIDIVEKKRTRAPFCT